MRVYFRNLLLLLSFIAFGREDIYAQKSGPGTSLACNCSIGNTEIQWLKMTNVKALKLPAKSGARKLPENYAAYTVSAKALKAYMMMLKRKGGHVVLPSSGQMGCKTYSVVPSGTMSPGLAARFPQIVSLKGSDDNDPASTVRIDYDGTGLQVEMYTNGMVYLLSPWKKARNTYYLLYKKEDSGVTRTRLPERPQQ